MLKYLKQETNKTYTENGAVTYLTTCSDCLDLFASAGALRNASEEEIIGRFLAAYAENPDLAMKLLFYLRDIRGGLGERRVFRVLLGWLAENYPNSVRTNLEQIAEFGRFDDLLTLLATPCERDVMQYIKKLLDADLISLEKGKSVSLLAKWLPSVNASNVAAAAQAKYVAGKLNMTYEQYRKTLSHLRRRIRIIENNLREKDYTFDYEKQPSKAMQKYSRAFLRNDEERYMEFLNQVNRGEKKLHTGTLTPYEIISPLLKGNVEKKERFSIDTAWNAQEDFTRGENALVVIDGSASMYVDLSPMPAAVALSLGIYFAERNTGAFKNHFITFSHNPRLVEIKGKDIAERLNYCKRYNEVADTNIQKVFELILNTAVTNHVPQEQLPETIYIISDMEFNWCTEDAGTTNFDYAKRIFAKHNYNLPKVVFWNVCSRNRQQPVLQNEQGVMLVSGCTPRIFSMVMQGKMTPYQYMLEVLNSPRYGSITA